MDLDLKDKTVLVTGSSKGIGFQIAALFAKEGAHVCLNGRSEKDLEAAKRKILDTVSSARLSAVVSDVSSQEGIQRIIGAVQDVDILVNNAAYYESRPFPEIRREDWQRMFDTNVLSGAALTQYYLPRMIRKNYGRVVFISSESAFNVPPDMVHYGMSKIAELAVARGAAELCKATNVTVNSVLPGPTMSEGAEAFIKALAVQQHKSVDQAAMDFIKDHRPSSINQRFAQPEEIANVVVFLGSARAAMINGTSIRVDGGVVKSI
jgi:NAD(P)-dependent dehydrogenase (short-subunit alcohol dehydrogenase family)